MISLFGSTYKTKILSIFVENFDEPITKEDLIDMVEVDIASLNDFLEFLISINIITKNTNTYQFNTTSKLANTIHLLDLQITKKLLFLQYDESKLRR